MQVDFLRPLLFFAEKIAKNVIFTRGNTTLLQKSSPNNSPLRDWFAVGLSWLDFFMFKLQLWDFLL